jgi:hypothetical protein
VKDTSTILQEDAPAVHIAAEKYMPKYLQESRGVHAGKHAEVCMFMLLSDDTQCAAAQDEAGRVCP